MPMNEPTAAASSSPLVTIVTPMFNTGAEVIETIDSIRKSTYGNVEHIIVDDASTDDSVAVVRAHLEETGHVARLEIHADNQGIARTRQHMIELARGKYIVGVADDLVRSDRIEKDVALLESLGDRAAGVFSIAQTFLHGTGEVLGEKGRWEGEVDADGCIPREVLAARLLESNFIAAMTCTLRRKVVVDVGYDTTFFIEDYPMWVRLLKAGYVFGYRDAISMDYRITQKSVRSRFNSLVVRDAVRSKALLLGSGLVPDEVVKRKTWRYFWSQITNFLPADRNMALRTVRSMGPPPGYGWLMAGRYVMERVGVWSRLQKRGSSETTATRIRKTSK